MTDIRAISWNEHSTKRWVKPSSYAFAARDHIAMVALHEIPKAMMQFPIPFIRNAEGYLPVVLQGFANGQNFAVSEQGHWLAEYIPAVYRCYPFRMAKNTDGNFVLCIDQASELVREGIAGFRFFDEDRKPSQETQAILGLLKQLEDDRVIMAKACQILDEQGVMEPWPLQIQTAEGLLPVSNLHRLNEAKLNQLPTEALLALRSCGGLTLSYGHLFSMQQIHLLAGIAQRKSWANKQQQMGQTPSLDIKEEEGILSFTNL
jgi:hypothetical protein